MCSVNAQCAYGVRMTGLLGGGGLPLPMWCGMKDRTPQIRRAGAGPRSFASCGLWSATVVRRSGRCTTRRSPLTWSNGRGHQVIARHLTNGRQTRCPSLTDGFEGAAGGSGHCEGGRADSRSTCRRHPDLARCRTRGHFGRDLGTCVGTDDRCLAAERDVGRP